MLYRVCIRLATPLLNTIKQYATMCNKCCMMLIMKCCILFWPGLKDCGDGYEVICRYDDKYS